MKTEGASEGKAPSLQLLTCESRTCENKVKLNHLSLVYTLLAHPAGSLIKKQCQFSLQPIESGPVGGETSTEKNDGNADS